MVHIFEELFCEITRKIQPEPISRTDTSYRFVSPDSTFGKIQKNETFFKNVLKALQSVIGECAKLKFVNEELLGYGRPISNMHSYAEIGYENEKQPCKNNCCWQDLKKAIDSEKTYKIKYSYSRNVSGNGWNRKTDTVTINPDYHPNLWELHPRGFGVAQPIPFAPFLWHELIGHGLYGYEHPLTRENTINPKSKYYDPTIRIENLARSCLGLRQRIQQYGWDEEEPKLNDLRPYYKPVPPPLEHPNGPAFRARR